LGATRTQRYNGVTVKSWFRDGDVPTLGGYILTWGRFDLLPYGDTW